MSEWIPTIALREPLWLLIAPIVWAMYRVWLRQSSSTERFSAFAETHLLEWLVIGRTTPGLSRLTLLAWLLIALALSGPYFVRWQEEPVQRGINIGLVLDISPSMTANDVEPDRLWRARLEAHDFLERLSTDRVALIAYSAYAYRVLPLTHDLALVSTYIDALQPALTRRHGSNLVQALELAAQSLVQSGKQGRAIVLLTDGETPDAGAVRAAADRLADQGIPVFALGIGSTTGAPVPADTGYQRGPDGELVISRLDRGLLQQLAQRSGGLYADARANSSDWDRLFTGLNGLARDKLALPPAATGYPLFPWLLAACLGLLIWTGRRRFGRVLPMLVIAPIIGGAVATAAPPQAYASPWSEQAAYAALQAGRYDEAATRYGGMDTFDGWLGQGAAAYRKGEWTQARDSFTHAERLAVTDEQRAKAVYNRANTLARMGRLDEALADLDAALRLHPNHARAALNRDLLSQAIRERSGSTPSPQDPPRIAASARNFSPGSADAAQASSSERRPEPGADATPGLGGAPRPEVMGAGREQDPNEGPAAGFVLGEAARSTLIQLNALSDDPREVLRHRFMVMDAARPRAPEDQAW